MSVPTIACFGTGGLEKRNVLQYLHSVWNLTQQYEWDEFLLLWDSCTGKQLKVRMPQPVLTRWEYVGQAINWVIVRFDDIAKMAQAAVNTNAAISAKNIIASAITSLTNEKLIRAHLHFLKGYHDSFFDIHFHWVKHTDPITKKNGYLSRHIAVHFYVMVKKIKEITDNWKTMDEFLPFVNYCNEKIIDPIETKMTFDSIPPKFFKLAHDMLLKHFNQWRSPLLLPIALCGDTIPAQALAGYMCGHGSNAHIPQSYHSATHHYDIDIPDLMSFLTELIKTPQKKLDNLIKKIDYTG